MRRGGRAVKILDLTAGNRAVWFDKTYPDATFIDVRPEVTPDVVASSCALPAEVGEGYDLIVFDPPHKTNGSQFGMARSYGVFSMEQIHTLLKDGAREAYRVSKPDALMAFKWNDHHNKLETALAYLTEFWEPLFGHGVHEQQRRGSSTSWVMLRRRSASTRSKTRPSPKSSPNNTVKL